MMAVVMVAVAVGRSPCMPEQRSINPVSSMLFASTNLQCYWDERILLHTLFISHYCTAHTHTHPHTSRWLGATNSTRYKQ
jgi:hypothetical protein